jgi:hypothetical protein
MSESAFVVAIFGLLIVAYCLIRMIFAIPRKSYDFEGYDDENPPPDHCGNYADGAQQEYDSWDGENHG